MKTFSLFMIAILALLAVGCAAEPIDAPAQLAPTEAELAASACEDYHAAHLAMCARCGIRPPAPASSPGAAWKYADCATVKTVRDAAALYDTCLPALETSCFDFSAGTPPSCHQFEF